MNNIEDECYECSSRNTIHRNGELICLNCGGIFEDENI